MSTIMGQFKCITVKTNSLNYSPHVPTFIMLTSKTSIFHKILYNWKETFRGEKKKIEFAVSAQALMISAFYKVINWLYEGKKQVVLHRALQIEFSLLFYFFPFLSTLTSPSLRQCIPGKKNELLNDNLYAIVPSPLPQQISALAARVWQNGGE